MHQNSSSPTAEILDSYQFRHNFVPLHLLSKNLVAPYTIV
jgi:hypothetical protein